MLQEKLKGLRKAEFSIYDLVEVANALLPELMSATMEDQRVREDISIRLVRHYTSAGLIDDPAKEGREARYGYRHLLQLLVLRRMQSEGVSSSAARKMPRGSDRDLERMLEIQDAPSDDNEALRYMQQIRQKAGLPAASRAKPSGRDAWMRLPVAPGLELHVRDDFEPPQTPKEMMDLQVRIVNALDRAGRRSDS